MPTEPIQRQEIRKLEAKGRRAVSKRYSTLESLKIEYVKTDSVYPNSYNPNRQSERDFELLLKSIQEDGFTQPILVQRQTREIVDGEHRWRACHHLGLEEIPVVFVDMTPEQMRISTLRHNRARGSEDIELTSAMLRDLRELGALDKAADSLMISDQELSALLDDLPAPESQANETFRNAWIPTEGKVTAQENVSQGGQIRTSTSEKAQEKIQEISIEISKAEDHMHASEISQTHVGEILHFSVTFGNEDAALVRSVLEPHPAQRLLDICKKKLELGA